MLGLSDGVFAFALTLLALNLELPEGLAPFQFRAGLLHLLSTSISYALSVAMIGIYWMAHQRMFRFIKCYNHRLLWLNLLFLTSITFIPPLTAILHDYGTMRVSVILYVGSLIISSILLALLWQHAIRTPVLITKDLDEAIARYYTMRSLSYLAVFLIAIAVSFYSPTGAQYVLFVLMGALPFIDRLRRPEHA